MWLISASHWQYTSYYLKNTPTHTHIQNYKHEWTPCLFLQVGGRLQLGTIQVLAAVGVSPHFGGRGYLDTGVRVNTPTLAPLSMGGHVTLEQDGEKKGAGLPGVLWNRLEGLMKLLGDCGVEVLPQNRPIASFGPACLDDPYRALLKRGQNWRGRSGRPNPK